MKLTIYYLFNLFFFCSNQRLFTYLAVCYSFLAKTYSFFLQGLFWEENCPEEFTLFGFVPNILISECVMALHSLSLKRQSCRNPQAVSAHINGRIIFLIQWPKRFLTTQISAQTGVSLHPLDVSLMYFPVHRYPSLLVQTYERVQFSGMKLGQGKNMIFITEAALGICFE